MWSRSVPRFCRFTNYYIIMFARGTAAGRRVTELKMKEIQDERTYYRNISKDTPLFKIIKLKYIVEMLKRGQIYIQNIQQWEDVYENYFLKQNLYVGGKKVDSIDAQRCFYGMSWTLGPESDAMWRIYSVYDNKNETPSDVGICVSTTAQKLLHCFWGELFGSPAIVGKVVYKSQEKIERDLNQLGLLGFNANEEIVNSLFTKRNEFAHENEARVVVTIPQEVPKKENLFPVTFNPAKFFDYFVIDPRANDVQDAYIREELNKAGASSKIFKSKLYTFTPVNIHL